MDYESKPQPATLIDAMAAHGVTIRAEFVPLSKSRNAKDKHDPKADHKWSPSLNWRVTLVRNGRDILTTDYSAGYGHCPGARLAEKHYGKRQVIAYECEHGRQGFYSDTFDQVMPAAQSAKPILPEPHDVLYSLCSDADVIDCGGFEEWASNLGYDTDSRKAEATYRACLDIALKTRAGLGEDVLQALRDACQDY